MTQSYTPRRWNLSGLSGISDRTLEIHFGLYEGYVKNTNLLNEQIAEKLKAGQGRSTDLGFSELTRRLGFEYNGMRLHEYYFDNLTGGGGDPSSRLRDALANAYGDFETWKADFAAVGGMRGVGWAIAYQDPASGRITNHWIGLHEDGNLAGFVPIVVMDVWEHAFMFDYKPSERPRYIEAFFANLNWPAAESRLVGIKQEADTVQTLR
ncbi:MAG: superoxide dismutase [Candidatus Eremiobacteraeota bacterium]|nr:superoxide dismutase [Candidatus Eremiobacteraeota bacterium]